jgi:hypothetical protein
VSQIMSSLAHNDRTSSARSGRSEKCQLRTNALRNGRETPCLSRPENYSGCSRMRLDANSLHGYENDTARQAIYNTDGRIRGPPDLLQACGTHCVIRKKAHDFQQRVDYGILEITGQSVRLSERIFSTGRGSAALLSYRRDACDDREP